MNEANICPYIDFELCVDPYNELNIASFAVCTDATCSVCTDAACNPKNTEGDGRQIMCDNGVPTSQSSAGFVACVCDGKVNCQWQSDDFSLEGEVDSSDFCITDSECPVTIWKTYQAHTSFNQNRFISHDNFNTLQANLFDDTKAESLGHISVDIFQDPVFQQYDYQFGHFLILFFADQLPDHVTLTPYEHYTTPAVSSGRKLFVFESFDDFRLLHDGSLRDLSVDIDVVLDVEHRYQPVDEITDLLAFKSLILPKSWSTVQGHLVSLTQHELVSCLHKILDANGIINF